MPKGLEAALLSEITPSDAELAAAPALLKSADDKKKKSLKGSVKSFLKSNNDVVTELKRKEGGAALDDVLEKFIVFQFPIPY